MNFPQGDRTKTSDCWITDSGIINGHSLLRRDRDFEQLLGLLSLVGSGHRGIALFRHDARLRPEASGKLEDLGPLRNVTARPSELGIVVQHDFVFSVEPRK